MEGKFAVIAITTPGVRPDEVRMINAMLDSGAIDRIHLRHPDIDEAATADILAAVRPEYLCRISLHDHHRLAQRFEGVGIHFNSRNPRREVECTGKKSAGVHNEAEMTAAMGLDYVLVSPVFDSISKKGYKANRHLSDIIIDTETPAIALGGVTPDRFASLKSAGYVGAAMSGYVDVEIDKLDEVLDTIKRNRNV